MEWKELPAENKWVLLDNGDTAAMIIYLDKDGIKNRFQVKSLISAIYLGKKKFSHEEKKKHDWYCTQRKFPSDEQRKRFIAAKKLEILSYITVRSS